MKILVTGGAGYIGSHTCVELLNNGYEIIAVDNFSNSHHKAFERIKIVSKKNFHFYETDVCDSDALDKICNIHKPSLIIHFAGLKSVSESVAMPLVYYKNNIGSTIALLNTMKKHNIKHIIFSSSATVYSATNIMPLTEDATRECINPYGWTKYMCEQIISDAVSANSKWSSVLLRYFNPIGAHESGLIGECPLGVPNNLLPYITAVAMGRRPELLVFGGNYETGDGSGVRDYIHVTDLAIGHVAAIKYCTSTYGTNAFNLGTGQGTSVLKMIDTFEKVNNTKIPYRIVDRRPGDIAVCYADPSKAMSILNWRTTKTLEEMCADVWRWQQNNPDGYINQM